MHGHMSRCMVTCHDARSHVTMHGHMSRCMVTCHDAWSHVTMHGHRNVKKTRSLLRTAFERRRRGYCLENFKAMKLCVHL
jgi:hypothetical protein